MNATLTRRLSDQGPQGTFGKLVTDDGLFECVTLEPPNPIDAGAYPSNWQWSDDHARNNFRLQNVPKHSGIEMHSGNLAGAPPFLTDSLDCILLGRMEAIFPAGPMAGTSKVLPQAQRGITSSRDTVAAFEAHMKQQPFMLTIKEA